MSTDSTQCMHIILTNYNNISYSNFHYVIIVIVFTYMLDSSLYDCTIISFIFQYMSFIYMYFCINIIQGQQYGYKNCFIEMMLSLDFNRLLWG